MKTTKTKSKDVLPEVVKHHLFDLHGLVRCIAAYAELPENWPLTQAEQVHFVRSITGMACKIKKSDGYVTSQVLLWEKGEK